MSERFLSIEQCPVHHFWAVCIGDGDSGTRLTPSKCCGSWKMLTQWKLSPEALREMANELECQADAASGECPATTSAAIPRAKCALQAGHAGLHRKGGLSWDESSADKVVP